MVHRWDYAGSTDGWRLPLPEYPHQPARRWGVLLAVDQQLGAEASLAGDRSGRTVEAANTRVRGGLMAETSETPILDLMAEMTAASVEATSLDDQALALVRIAALVAVDAPPASYLVNLGAASEIGIDEEQVKGVLAAVAPIVGTVRVASAVGNIARALGFAMELAELAEE